ncbi:hypothetical protein IW140_003382 [Coemansia sp. RSA 1813]|nr:hypothetical protein EV178_003200 [Coemansia sp. RSA 1646]KAJ1771007.1 hypothetical protein LPJ74_002698 [Coemansia sp. RSA 1843]KAJ2089247.1 hypothetical protein IW138_003567 [Coemansia sp. RSA 986]KAJ2215076.1 hypothetical protein EV179_002444 [Coemansia sp. RSA 487]KAJ2569017.1 hypothetical protein IW140_003382 [Coemansia sp. RSA 1813]
MLPTARASSSRVRINIPTVNVSEAWTPAPLRKQHLLGPRLLRLYLPFVLVISLVLNIYYFTRPTPLSLPSALSSTQASTGQVQHEYETVDFGQITDLIIVPGHGIYTNEGPPLDESNWHLLQMQRGEVGAFMAHIGKAVEMVKEQDSALLMFSGGKTRLTAGMFSEAQGYWTAADRMGWLAKDVYRRVFTEEYARDSYENVLFSIARFREITGHYPDRITVVGFEFKKDRFLDLHRKALRYPKIRFNYVGINPPGDSTKLLQAERENAYKLFEKDLYGCKGRLAEKKRERNPFMTAHGYASSCPEIAAFFNYCPSNPVAVYEGSLPWLS